MPLNITEDSIELLIIYRYSYLPYYYTKLKKFLNTYMYSLKIILNSLHANTNNIFLLKKSLYFPQTKN